MPQLVSMHRVRVLVLAALSISVPSHKVMAGDTVVETGAVEKERAVPPRPESQFNKPLDLKKYEHDDRSRRSSKSRTTGTKTRIPGPKRSAAASLRQRLTN